MKGDNRNNVILQYHVDIVNRETFVLIVIQHVCNNNVLYAIHANSFTCNSFFFLFLNTVHGKIILIITIVVILTITIVAGGDASIAQIIAYT